MNERKGRRKFTLEAITESDILSFLVRKVSFLSGKKSGNFVVMLVEASGCLCKPSCKIFSMFLTELWIQVYGCKLCRTSLDGKQIASLRLWKCSLISFPNVSTVRLTSTEAIVIQSSDSKVLFNAPFTLCRKNLKTEV